MPKKQNILICSHAYAKIPKTSILFSHQAPKTQNIYPVLSWKPVINPVLSRTESEPIDRFPWTSKITIWVYILKTAKSQKRLIYWLFCTFSLLPVTSIPRTQRVIGRLNLQDRIDVKICA